MTVRLEHPPSEPVRLGFDVVPGGLPLPGGGRSIGQDVAVVVDPQAHTAVASMRGDLDPVLLDGQPKGAVPPPGRDGWTLQRMSTNRPFDLDGRHLPPEYLPVGNLREGVWDPKSPRADSRSTWHLDGNVLTLRLPWSMLAMGDPSSRTAVQPVGGLAKAVPVEAISLLVDAGRGGSASGSVRWEIWQQATFTERQKPGVQPLVDAWQSLSRPVR